MGESRSARGWPAAGADLAIPALAVGLALYFFWSIAGLEWEAKANGVVIGTILLVLIAIQLGRTCLQVARGEARFSFDPLLQPRVVLYKRLALVGLMALFVATIPYLGTVLGLTLAMAAALAVLGVRSPQLLIGLPVAVAMVLHLLFVTFLGAKLPAGPIEWLIAQLAGGGV